MGPTPRSQSHRRPVHAGGTVWFGASRRVSDGADRIGFRRKDTGVGTKAEDQAQILEAFTRADGSAARRHGGTGLCLAISLRLAQMTGGSITVQSAPGVGLTFEVSLPAEPPTDAAADP